MISFLALYRGPTLDATQLVSVTSDPIVVARFAADLLRKEVNIDAEDRVTAEVREGRRRALELVRGEAEADCGPVAAPEHLHPSEPTADSQ